MAPFFTGITRAIGGAGFGKRAGISTPPPVLLTFTVVSGSGQSPGTFSSYPLSGVGGKTVATVLTPINQIFKIYVGKIGSGTGGAGYYNGGPGGRDQLAGGGASAVTFGLSPVCTAETMIMGAGGGGAMGGPATDAYGSGGYGGGGTSSGTPGSQQMNGSTAGGPPGGGSAGSGNTFPGTSGGAGSAPNNNANGGGGGGGFSGGGGGSGFLYSGQRWIAGGGGGGGGYINIGSNFPNVLETVTVTLTSSGNGDINNSNGSVVVVGPAGTTTYPSSPGSYTVPAASL
jgi:hypothetical protein